MKKIRFLVALQTAYFYIMVLNVKLKRGRFFIFVIRFCPINKKINAYY